MIVSFHHSLLETYCNFSRPEVSMTNAWVEDFNKSNNYQKVLRKLWIEGKQFKSQDIGLYPTTNLRETYIYDVSLANRLYEEKYTTHF